MSKPSASALLEPKHSAPSFHTQDASSAPRSKPFLAWDDAAAYSNVAWLPAADAKTARQVRAKRFVIAATAAALAMLALGVFGSRSTSNATVAECRVSEPQATFGVNTETQMLVRGGLPCPIWTRIAGNPVNELAVTVPPKNGSLSPRGRTGVFYRPAPNYRGSDVFGFAMRGQSTSTVRVKVTVE